jgi:hypothetical protein
MPERFVQKCCTTQLAHGLCIDMQRNQVHEHIAKKKFHWKAVFYIISDMYSVDWRMFSFLELLRRQFYGLAQCCVGCGSSLTWPKMHCVYGFLVRSKRIARGVFMKSCTGRSITYFLLLKPSAHCGDVIHCGAWHA